VSPIVIGLLSRLGGGKTTAARYLCEEYGARTFTIAGPLKKICLDTLGVTYSQLYGTQAQKALFDPKLGKSSRDAVISLGEAIKKHLGQDTFIDKCIKDIFNDYYADFEDKLYVIDDVRFPFEAKALKMHPKLEVSIIKLVCPDATDVRFQGAVSEVSVDQVPNALVDFELISYTSPKSEDLKKKLDIAMELILKSPKRATFTQIGDYDHSK